MKIILFDFFGVLSTPVYKKVIETHLPVEEHAHWMEKLHELDTDRISEAQFTKDIAERAGVQVADVEKTVREAPIRNTELFDFIEANLKHTYTLGLFTNIPRSLLERIAGDKLSLFDHLFVSSDLGLVKPDTKIFEIVISRCGVLPEEILFIDDSETNVTVAKSLGMKSFVYTDFPSFVKDIGSYL